MSSYRFKHSCVLTLSLQCLCGFAMGGEAKLPLEAMRGIYQEAEAAMAQGDYALARNRYLEMLARGAKTQANESSFVDLVLHLATAESSLGDHASAEKRLSLLLQETPPEDLMLRIESTRAQLRQQQGMEGEAYRTLKHLGKLIPLDRWPSEEKSFLNGLEYSLNRKYGELLRHAERLFDAALYEESLPLYQELLKAVSQQFYPALDEDRSKTQVDEIRFRLAEAGFQSKNFGEALQILDQLSFANRKDTSRLQHTKLEKNVYYLLGRVYQEMGKKEHAITSFQTYLELDEQKNLPYRDEALWSMGLLYFQREAFPQAEASFKNLAANSQGIKYYYLSRLYLARIYLQREQYDSVEQTLFPLLGVFTDDEALRYEAAYLRGEAFFQKRNYLKATELFEQALPKRNKELAAWYGQALYNLGWSYLKLAENSQEPTDERRVFFEKSEKAFKDLVEFKQSDDAYLSLARLHLLKARVFQDDTFRQEAAKVLGQKEAYSSLDREAEALLLQSDIQSSFAEKAKTLGILTSELYEKTPSYGLGWFARGVNAFQQGKQLLAQPEAQAGKELLNQAIDAFQLAFQYLETRNLEKAALALKNAAHAAYYLESGESRLKAYRFFHHLVHEYSEGFGKMKNRDEVLYLMGLTASRLLYEDGQENFVGLASASLLQIVDHYQGGAYVDKALNLLGTLRFREGRYDEAEAMYTQLATNYPQSEFAGNAWFGASECAEWQHKDLERIKDYRKKVFELYPQSTYAAEAYFKFFNFGSYLQGNGEALAHLQNMELFYPQSPYLIVAQFLIGMNHKQDRKAQDGSIWKKADLPTAVHAFEEAPKVFDRCYAQGLIPAKDLDYFIAVRYRALLERALIKLRMAKQVEGAKQQVYLEWAADAFEDILKDFHDPEHPLARLLTKSSPYPKILEESEYGLAQVYLQAREYADAEEVLSKMLERYSRVNVKRGYYLSRAWYEQGKIAMQKHEPELALKFFDRAEESAKGGFLSLDQKLDLWIHQSHAYRDLHEYDTAMLMLSRVVNEDVTSPLRLKAMYLRSEIYELEGRHDLAVKQLEATAKKGGEWANKAKEKLEFDYGFN